MAITDRGPPLTLAIRAEHLSKTYKLRRERGRTLKETFLRQYAPAERVQGLQDVCFWGEPGGSFGVVGAKSSGESPLLQLLPGRPEPARAPGRVTGHVHPA